MLAVTDLSVGLPKIIVFVWAKIEKFTEKKNRMITPIFEPLRIANGLILTKNIWG